MAQLMSDDAVDGRVRPKKGWLAFGPDLEETVWNRENRETGKVRSAEQHPPPPPPSPSLSVHLKKSFPSPVFALCVVSMIIPATSPSASLDPVSLPGDSHSFPAESQLRLDSAEQTSSAASVLDSQAGGSSDPSAPRAPPGADQSIQYMIATMKGLLARAQESTADMEALEGLNTMNRKLNVLMGT